MIKQRIEAVRQKLMQQKDPSAFVIVSAQNRRYMTNIATSNGYAIITPENKYFFTDSRYIEYAKKSLENIYEAELLPIKEAKEHYGRLLKKENIKTVFYEENYISLKTKKIFDELFSDFNLCESGGMIEKMRQIKDDFEIASIQKAQDITDRAFAHILKTISSDPDEITEKDISAEIEYFMKKNGADKPAFDTIAVSGKKSSYPHGEPENIKISKGFLTMDFGAVCDGYCSDMTRTVCIGKPTSQMLEVYEIVKSAQTAALNKIKAGVYGGEVDKEAREIIKKAGYGDNFGHGLGHSVGLEIHESPGFHKSGEDEKDKTEIAENMVITVEPGIYIENRFGVRIEDLVVVKQNGCLNLTKSPKELTVI